MPGHHMGEYEYQVCVRCPAACPPTTWESTSSSMCQVSGRMPATWASMSTRYVSGVWPHARTPHGRVRVPGMCQVSGRMPAHHMGEDEFQVCVRCPAACPPHGRVRVPGMCQVSGRMPAHHMGEYEFQVCVRFLAACPPATWAKMSSKYVSGVWPHARSPHGRVRVPGMCQVSGRMPARHMGEDEFQVCVRCPAACPLATWAKMSSKYVSDLWPHACPPHGRR